LRSRTRVFVLPLAAVVAVALVAAGCGGGGGGGNPTTTQQKKVFKTALVSDIGLFTDKGFNQNQLAGLKKAESQLGITGYQLQSNSASDYAPNFNTAIRKGSNLIIAAGFLLAPTLATFAKKYPKTDFAITDYGAEVPPLGSKKYKPLFKNVEGLTYAANESGCLVGVLAAKMAQKMGGNAVGAVGGIKIPPVDIWIAGYKYCVDKVVPGMKVIVQYSNSFTATDKCQQVAQNEIGEGAKVLFQVAGGCGLGTLTAADNANIWGIGVDVDQYNLAKRVLTSGIKRVDTGVYDAIQQAESGHFKGGTDLVFDLKNNGMGVGKINPAVPQSWITLMNHYKQQIIAGTLKVPSSLG
jgi:basic membrane protein A